MYAASTALLRLDQHATEDYFTSSDVDMGTAASPVPLHGVIGVLDVAQLRMILFGGCDPANIRAGCSAALWAHDIPTNTWTRIAPSGEPSPRAGGSATMIGGHVFIFGGDASGTLMNDLFVLDAASLAWSRAPRCLRRCSLCRVSACFSACVRASNKSADSLAQGHR